MTTVSCRLCGSAVLLNTLGGRWAEGEWPEDPKEEVVKGRGCPTCWWGEDAEEIVEAKGIDKKQLEATYIRTVLENTPSEPITFRW